MNSHHFYNSDFADSLTVGKYNEKVVADEFSYHGIPLVSPPDGKHPFDRYLPSPTGLKSVEIKADFRSQRTGHAVIEYPTLQRGANFYIHTFTTARVYTHDQYMQLYMRGKIPAGGMGQYGYDGRYIRLSDMRAVGMPLYQFINGLKELTNAAA